MPGARIAGRYRMVALLGKGGMGEVYQADDLKLGQTVALKFLPAGFAQDAQRLEYFHNEVRLARQVSHPNVCRVHDIGEVDGLHYLSMEFIDGEDLRSLLRRIGRLPSEKGIEIAAQLCASLAAAHDKGVIHRDLKPANVMIDGRGRVRITDFGLAWDSDSSAEPGATVGTPAYMAPEQLLSGETSVQSDLYALGLILYELFTGKPPLKDRAIEQLRQAYKQPSEIEPPSSVVSDLDPMVEQVILRCLKHDPADRPRSVGAVAAAMPGGDPLAASLAAGQTPSPALVASSGPRKGLHPLIGGLLISVVLIQLAAAAWLFDRNTVLGIVRRQIPTPQVMENRAREVLAGLGYSKLSHDEASWFVYDSRSTRRLREQNEQPDWTMLREARPTPIQFVYRASPITLESHDRSKLSVEPRDPPINVRGMTMVRLDLKMRLSRLLAVPPVTEEGATTNQEPDWETLLEYAGIAPESLKRCDSVIVPSRYADARMAWEGVLDGDTEPVRVEAAFHVGKPVSFQVIPIDQLENVLAPPRPEEDSFAPYVIVPLLLIVAVNLTLRNFRSGRVDWRGALTVSLSVFVAGKLSSILAAKSISYVLQHPDRLVSMLLDDIWAPLLVFSLYAAIEPMVRRAWPQTLVSWTRMLSGNFTDPLVGRDLLIGCVLGGTLVTASLFNPWFTNHLSSGPLLATLLGTRHTLGDLLKSGFGALFLSLVYLFVLLVLRLLVKRNWLAIVSFMLLAVLVALVAVLSTTDSDVPLKLGAAIVLAIAFVTFVLTALTRFGLLATVTSAMVLFSMQRIPVSLDTSVWYWEHTSLTVMLAIVALSGFGVLTSYRGWVSAQQQ